MGGGEAALGNFGIDARGGRGRERIGVENLFRLFDESIHHRFETHNARFTVLNGEMDALRYFIFGDDGFLGGFERGL